MIMESFQFLNITTFAYLASAILYIAILIFGGRSLGLAATLVTAGGLLLNTIGIVLRWNEAFQRGFGYYAPFSNMYESLVFFAWCTALIYLVIERKYKNQTIGAFSMPFAFLGMALAEYWPQWSSDLNPLVPALQSNWLIFHVITYFIGYAALAVAFGVAVMYLLKNRSEKAGRTSAFMASLPSLKILDELIYKSILFGFVLFTVGTTSGAVWANSAWGTYWSWDPKETWSLITWFVYAATIHAKYTRGWGGERIAWLAIFGFICVMFTYYGVNFLLSGLHSYG
jgi:cytochrome c-type biogenesis protein CcsB